jgi:DNA polymerase-1
MKILSYTEGDLREVAEKLAATPVFGLDFETTSGYPHEDAPLHHDKLIVTGYGFGFPDGEKTYVPLAHIGDKLADKQVALSLLEKVLTDKDKEVWAHNAKFEMMVSRTLGIEMNGSVRDSMLAQHLLGKKLKGGKGLKLKPAAQKYLKHKMKELDDVLPPGGRAHEVPSGRMASYCADDALQCLRLGELWVPELKEQGLLKIFEELECPFIDVLVHMREVGFALDNEILLGLHEEFSAREKKFSDEFIGVVGSYTGKPKDKQKGLWTDEYPPISISSSSQVSQQLYDILKWWPADALGFKRGKSGNYSVDRAHLEKVSTKLKKDSPGWKALQLKRGYNDLATLNSTFTTSLADKSVLWEDKRLRCDFNQTGTPTGRLSSSKPNFQNIPARTEDGRKIREAFISEPGWDLVVTDYDQAELRMMAHCSRDEALLRAYAGNNTDVHTQTAEACGCDRNLAKTINFGIIYGMQENTLASRLKVAVRTAKQFHAKYFALYRGVKRYHEEIEKYCLDNGYVKTIIGRIRKLPEIYAKNKYRQGEALRAAFNTPIQGSVGDVMKIAMRNLVRDWKERGILYDYYTKEGKVKIVSQVHDEIICETKKEFSMEAAADVKRHMENAAKLRVPMLAEPGLGSNWMEAKKNTIEI